MLAADSTSLDTITSIFTVLTVAAGVLSAFAFTLWGRDRRSGEHQRERLLELELEELRARRARRAAGEESDIPSGTFHGGDGQIDAETHPSPEERGPEPSSPTADTGSGPGGLTGRASYVLAVVLALITLGGTVTTAYLARADAAPPDCVAYVEHLAALDPDLDPEAESAFGRVARYEREAEECGTPAAILPTLGGD
jgi:hypothetical protein